MIDYHKKKNRFKEVYFCFECLVALIVCLVDLVKGLVTLVKWELMQWCKSDNDTDNPNQ